MKFAIIFPFCSVIPYSLYEEEISYPYDYPVFLLLNACYSFLCTCYNWQDNPIHRMCREKFEIFQSVLKPEILPQPRGDKISSMLRLHCRFCHISNIEFSYYYSKTSINVPLDTQLIGEILKK